jgi:hypothetical protein
MKRARIRHLGDKSTFYGESGWSSNPENARDFATPLQAIAFIIQNKISNAELVVEGNQKEQFAVAVQGVDE